MSLTDAQRRYERLLALNGADMPERIDADGAAWTRLKVFKHDFFAATGLYESSDGRQGVLKIFRPFPYMGIPVQWLSAIQARHEERIYLALQDTGSVPKWFGRVGPTGILHEFVPGSHLNRCETVRPTFFEELRALLKTMHQRGIAYVDTNKPDNIIVAEPDGRPLLIDFQITWVQPPFPLSLLTLPVFHIFKASDMYHAFKHEHKRFPDRITREMVDDARPWYLNIHRIFANPVRRIRRNYLRKVEAEAKARPEGSERH